MMKKIKKTKLSNIPNKIKPKIQEDLIKMKIINKEKINN